MASRNREKRQKRRRRRKMKPSFRNAMLILAIIVIFGGYTGSRYYISTHMPDRLGGINTQDLQEDDSFTVTRGSAEYTVLKAGQGEAILIKKGAVEVLIDTGTKESAKKLCKRLKSEISGSLDYLILTSSSAGRLGGLKRIMKDFTVDTCIVGEMGDMKDEISDMTAQAVAVVAGDNLAYDIGDDATVFIIKPDVSSDDVRDRSLVTYFTFGETGFLALSDAGKEEISRAFGNVSACDVVVLSRNGTKEVNMAVPQKYYKYVVASASRERSMFSEDLAESLGRQDLYYTGVTGTLKFITDGTNIELDKEDVISEKARNFREGESGA